MENSQNFNSLYSNNLGQGKQLFSTKCPFRCNISGFSTLTNVEEETMKTTKDYEYDYSHDPDERYVGDEDEAGDEPDTSEMETATSW